MKYNVDFFIKKFESIPEELWITMECGYKEEHCALGHCGVRAVIGTGVEEYFMTQEAKRLVLLLSPLKQLGKEGNNIVNHINDGIHGNYKQPTPKQRILAALYDIKSEDAVKEAQKILNTKTQLQKSMKKTIMLLSAIAIMSACGKSANEPIQADTSIENGSKDKPVITITSLCYNAQFGYRVGFTITNTKPGDKLYGGCVGYGGDTLSIVSLMGLDGEHLFYGTTRESGCNAKVYVADVSASHQITKEIMPGNCVNCEP